MKTGFFLQIYKDYFKKFQTKRNSFCFDNNRLILFQFIFVEVPAKFLLEMNLKPVRLRLQAGVDRFFILLDGGEKLGQNWDQKIVARYNVDEKIVGNFPDLKTQVWKN